MEVLSASKEIEAACYINGSSEVEFLASDVFVTKLRKILNIQMVLSSNLLTTEANSEAIHQTLVWN